MGGFRWKGGVGRWGQVLIDKSHALTAVSSSLRWLSPGPCLEACVNCLANEICSTSLTSKTVVSCLVEDGYAGGKWRSRL